MKHKRMITLLLVLAMLLGILPVTAAAADVPAAATLAQPNDEGWLAHSELHGYADSSESGRGPNLAFDNDWSDSETHHPGWHSQWSEPSTESNSKGTVKAENGKLTGNNNFYIVLDEAKTVDQVDIYGSWWSNAAGNGSVYTCRIYVSSETVTSNDPNIEWGNPVFDNTAGNTAGNAAFTYSGENDLRKSAQFSAPQENVKSIKLEYVTAHSNCASAWEIFVHTVAGQEPEQEPVEITNIFAESYRDDNYAEALTDGNPASSWRSKYAGGETATNHYPRVGEAVSFEQTNSEPLSQYNNLYLVLKEPSDVSNVLMQAKWHDNEDTLTNGTPKGVRIYVSDDKVMSNTPNIEWGQPVFDNTGNGFTYENSHDTVKVADFGTTQNNVSSIRIEFCTTYADSGTVTNQWMQLVEVGVNEDPYDLSLIEFYPNVLDATKNGFSDNGVWSKYYLPGANDTAKFGGFGGPKYVDRGGLKDYNVAKWQITKGSTAEPLTLSNYSFNYLASKGNECFGLRTQDNNLLKFYSCGENNGWHNADATNVARGQKVRITATYDSGTKTMTLYVDGTKSAEAANATVAANNNTSLSLGLATFNSSDHFENSHTFHSFHVFSRALSADEIQTVKAQDSATLVWYDFNTVHYSDEGETPSQVSKDALNAAIEEAKKLTESDYTEDSWKAFSDALKKAEEISSKADATQDEVNAATTALTAAQSKLKTKDQPQTVDKSKLQELYNALKGTQDIGYPTDVWNIFTSARDHVKDVLDNPNATQDEVNAAKTTLENAAAGLTQIAPPTPVIPVTPSEPAQLPFNPNAGSNVSNFPFVDVPSDSWYYSSVKAAWENSLIDGVTANEFKPNATLTVAQTIKLAAALHQLDRTGEVNLKNGGSNWYDNYVNYAVTNGIIEKDYANYTKAQMNAPVTRGEFVHIFHGAEEAYKAINTVTDNAIPDVKATDKFAAEIYEFYRAGILTGSDAKGTFHSASTIKRSEAAAILLRMFEASARKSIALN